MNIQKYSWGEMHWVEEGDANLGFTYANMIVYPHSKTDKHYHSNCSEMIFMMDGDILLHQEEQEISLRRNDKSIIASNCKHYFTNITDKPVSISVVYSTEKRDYFPV